MKIWKKKKEKINNKEYSNSKLASLYDTFNPLTEDKIFWLDIIKKLNVKKIADLGCGTGLLTCELSKLGYDVVGLDPFGEMLEVAKKKNCLNNEKWIKGSSEKLEENFYDLVVMTTHVSQFFLGSEEWENALEDIRKSLKLGGHILFDSKNPKDKPWLKWNKENSYNIIDTTEGKVGSWVELISEENNKFNYKIHYNFDKTSEEIISNAEIVYRSKEEIIESLEKNGFDVEKIYGYWDHGDFDKNSPEIIILAKKK